MSSEPTNSTEPNPENEKQENITNSQDNEPVKEIGFFQILISVFAAMFGVQSESKHKRDFEQGSASNFIAAGIIFVILLIATLFFVVSSVIENAGVN